MMKNAINSQKKKVWYLQMKKKKKYKIYEEKKIQKTKTQDGSAKWEKHRMGKTIKIHFICWGNLCNNNNNNLRRHREMKILEEGKVRIVSSTSSW